MVSNEGGEAMRSVRSLLGCTLLLTLSSCGSILTARCRQGGWSYPYEGFVQDLLMVSDEVVGTRLGYPGFDLYGAWVRGGAFGGVLSAPFDLVLGTLWLPVNIGDGIYRLCGGGDVPLRDGSSPEGATESFGSTRSTRTSFGR